MPRSLNGQWYTPAYSPSGIERPWHAVCVGDLVEWKRQGYTGFARAQVASIAPTKLLLVPVDRAGKAAGRARWVFPQAIMRIYEGNSDRRRAPAPLSQQQEIDRAWT